MALRLAPGFKSFFPASSSASRSRPRGPSAVWPRTLPCRHTLRATCKTCHRSHSGHCCAMPCRAVDAVHPAELLGAQSRLVLLQDVNNLLLAESAFPHRLSPRLENRLTSNRGLCRGASHILSLCGRKLPEMPKARRVGGPSRQVTMVAGVGFEPTTFRL